MKSESKTKYMGEEYKKVWIAARKKFKADIKSGIKHFNYPSEGAEVVNILRSFLLREILDELIIEGNKNG